MLIAITGVTVAVVLWLAGIMRPDDHARLGIPIVLDPGGKAERVVF